MPTKDEHRAKAEHDEFFASQLDNPFWDWALTSIFYAGLHYVDAYFATLVPPGHPPTHQVRDSRVYADPKLAPIYVDYRQLEDESRDARYDAAATFSQSDVEQARKYLQRIKETVLPLI